jgi:hypothetical protein
VASAGSISATAEDAPPPPAASSLGAAPASASASARPPAPSKIELRVEGAPRGAKVAIDGKHVGVVPGPFEVAPGASIELTVSAKGYKKRAIPLTVANDDVIVPVTLEKQVSPPPKKGTSLSKDLEGFDSK